MGLPLWALDQVLGQDACLDSDATNQQTLSPMREEADPRILATFVRREQGRFF